MIEKRNILNIIANRSNLLDVLLIVDYEIYFIKKLF